MIDLTTFLENFHFLRPYFLLALPVGMGFFYTLRHSFSGQSSWKSVIDASLLTHLIDQPENNPKKSWHVASLFIAWIIACFAMAGPAWERLPQNAEKNQDALIIILDLSLSMYAEDQKPSRIINARRKIADLLTARKDGLTALIVYSGDAHIVTPLTTDTETIATLIPVLEPGMMPKIGTNLGSAILEADNILTKSGSKKADVILLTDEITESQFSLLENMGQKNLHLSLLTFGTSTGAPIPMNNGFMKTQSGDTVIAKLNWDDIASFASANHILAVQSNFDDSDIHLLLDNLSTSEKTQATERTFDLWQDAGHWLTLLLIPFMLINFRRGWILLVLLVVIPDNSYAMSWDDLWQTKDQQAAAAFKNGDIKNAAGTFENPLWKASAEYKNGNYQGALDGFKQDTSAHGLYNKGNALAKSGLLDEAIKAYDEALKKQPDLADAEFNKSLVKKLLDQQKQQDKQQQQNKQNQDQQNQDKDQQQDQQNGDQKKDGEQQQQGENNQQQADNKPQDSSDSKPGESKPDESKPDESKQNADASDQQSEQQSQQADSADKNDENKKAAEQQAQQAPKNDSTKPDDKKPEQAVSEMTPMEKEQQQALQQWLRKIPDDPGQLLRNKFRYQYENNRNQNEHIDKDSEQLW